jgi:hypothetical protein
MESRSTFRKKVTDEAWQYKIRVQKENDWLKSGRYKFWENIDLSLKKSIVREVERKTAEKIILEYEWLGDMAVTNKYYGIFFGPYCGGVICINTGGHSAQGEKQFGILKGELSYFARGACPFWTPKGTASKLLSFALKLEKKRGVKMAIAYADHDAGEYGTVYQATNWIFIGYSKPKPQYVKNNKILDSRVWEGMFSKDKSIKERLEKNGWKKQYGSPKARFIYILADEPYKKSIFTNIKHLVAQYPKRQNAQIEKGISSDIPV